MFSIVVFNQNQKPLFGFVTSDINKANDKLIKYQNKYPDHLVEFRLKRSGII